MSKETNFTVLAEKFNLAPCYFSQVKRENIDKYNRFFSYDEDEYKSILKYIDDVEKAYHRMEEILTYFENSKTRYGILLKENNLTTCKTLGSCWHTDFKTLSFPRYEDEHFLEVSYGTFTKWEKIISLFDVECVS